MDIAPDKTTEGLAGFVLARFDLWGRQRQDLELKWERNRAAYRRDAVRFDELFGTWKKDERQRPNNKKSRSGSKTDTCVDVAKTKAITAKNIVADVLLKGGRVNFMLVPADVGAISSQQRPDQAWQDAANRDVFIQTQEQLLQRQLEESNADREFENSILAGAVYGETVVKRFLKDFHDEHFSHLRSNVYEMVSSNRQSMAVRLVPIWNIFRDLETDDTVDSDGMIERDWSSPFMLRQLGKNPTYWRKGIDKAVKECIEGSVPETQGGSGDALSPRKRNLVQHTRTIKILEFWGRAPRKDVERIEREMAEDKANENLPNSDRSGFEGKVETSTELPSNTTEGMGDKGDMVECHVVMADTNIIRFMHTKPGDRPYYRCAWENDIDGLGGIGVVDNVEQEVMVLNGAIRAMQKNAKKISNVLAVVKRELIDDDVTEQTLENGGLLDAAEHCDDARKAIQQVTFQNIIGPLSEVISLFMPLADQASQIPKAEQGQQEPNAQTWGELNARLERAGKYMAGVIRNYDAMIEKVVSDFFRWNMLDPQVQAKGNWKVKALGFSSFENKVTRLQRLMQLLNLILGNPQLMELAKLRWLLHEITIANDIEPAQLWKSPDELEAEAQQKQQLQAQQTAAGENTKDQAQAQLIKAQIQRLMAEAKDREAGAALKVSDAEKNRADVVLKRADMARKITADNAKREPVAAPIEQAANALPA